MTMRLLGLLLAACLGAAHGAPPAVVDVYEYVPDQVYPVRTALGLTTQIELDATDPVLDFSTGFSSGWDLVRRDNVFYLRPRDIDVDTNMLVRTERNAYIFELKVVASDWVRLEQAREAGAQYRIRFNYPQQPAAPEAGQAVDAGNDVVESGIHVGIAPGRAYHFGYDYAAGRSDPWLVPVHVYDDQHFTYIHLARGGASAGGGFPAVFGRESADGEDFVVNTTVRGDVLVVHGTFPFLLLRHGENVVGLRRSVQ